MDKLVRDGVPEFLRKQGTHITFREATEQERANLLFTKLLEEAGEWLTARDDVQRLKELGDLQEVIWALGESVGITPEEILLQAHTKQKARGGFGELQVMGVELGPADAVYDEERARSETSWPGGRVPDVIANNSYAYSG